MNDIQHYDFSHISEIVKEIHRLYEPDEAPTDAQLQELSIAIAAFYRTRTVSELFDIYDWSDDVSTLSIHDFQDLLTKPFVKEMETRSVWVGDDIRDVLNVVHPEWAGKDNLKARVDGIQKKVDKIVQLLEKFNITMSVGDALRL